MQIDFDKMDGLAPAIVQEDSTGEVLMVGFMNEAALARTRETGYVTFFSRTRNTLWTKGETSGNRLAVVSMLVDCDEDTLLVQAPTNDGEPWLYAVGDVNHRALMTHQGKYQGRTAGRVIAARAPEIVATSFVSRLMTHKATSVSVINPRPSGTSIAPNLRFSGTRNSRWSRCL